MKVRCAIDTRLFAECFFPHHCRRSFSAFHLDVLERHVALGIEDVATRRGRRWAIAAPRGSAKTTLCSLILLMHDILYRRERYVTVISATLKQAAQRLRNLRGEILANERLRAVYARELERKGEFRAHSFLLNDVQIEAYGSGAEIRGVSCGPWRPTKIVLDDVEDSEGVESAAQREKLRDWFHEVVENLGDTYTHLVAIGTILHPESLLTALLGRPDFESRLYRAVEAFSPRQDLWAEWRRRYVDLGNPRRAAAARAFFQRHRQAMLEDTRVLWPEKEDYHDLMVQLVTLGRRAFYQEKQNEPLGRASAVFDPSVVRRFRLENGRLILEPPRSAGAFAPLSPTPADPFPGVRASRPPAASPEGDGPGGEAMAAARSVALADLRTFGFLDPALGRGAGERGRTARGDFAALAVVGSAGDGAFHLLELWVRRAVPMEQIRAAFDLHERWRLEGFGVEGNCFQELLHHPLEAERERRRAEGRASDLAVEMIVHRRNKIERIAALEPLFANGWLTVADAVPEEFWRELQSFPGGDHDDALDAVEGAVDLARRAMRAARSSPIRASRSGGRAPGGLRDF